MTQPWPLIFALIAAFLYVGAVLAMKRAAELGAGVWESTFASNIGIAVAFQVVLVFGGEWQPAAFWWQPVLVALIFLLGQSSTLYSLQHGDVSIATPVLGLKIILVALLSTVIASADLAWQIWMAALLATLGIAALNHPGAHRIGSNARVTIVSAGLAALSFAMFDVLVQKWSPIWGFGRFLPATMAVMGLLSLGFRRFFKAPLSELSKPTLKWLAVGCTFFAAQTIVFVSSIGYFGSATAMNVVYSSRGIWSILAVLWLGHWFHSQEKSMTGPVLRWRFAGAGLMFAAILLVLAPRA